MISRNNDGNSFKFYFLMCATEAAQLELAFAVLAVHY